MELKKIQPWLKTNLHNLGITKPNEMQLESWSTIRSGADCVLASKPASGKTITLLLNILQKLAKPEGESTRALLLVTDRDAVVETARLAETLAEGSELRIIGTHEKGDIDYDKNQISAGNDLIIATPTKIAALFGSAGFNLGTVRLIALDDADVICKNRQDTTLHRLAESVAKTQYVFTCTEVTEKVEILADRLMTEARFFEMEEDEE